MDGGKSLSDMIGLIYDAALAPERWPLFLDRLCDLAPNAKAILMLRDSPTSSVTMMITARWEDDWLASYAGQFVGVNGWALNFSKAGIGRAFMGEALVAGETLIDGEFYTDWLKPQQLIAGAAATATHEHSRFMNISFLHDDVPDWVADRNIVLLQALQPHLLRAAQMQRLVSAAEARSHALENAFDHLDLGVILLDLGGHSFYVNRRAHGFLALRDGLTLDRDGRVSCVGRDAQIAFDRTIRDAGLTAAGRGQSAGGAVAIQRSGSSLPWSVLVAPIPCRAMDLGRPEGAVAVFIIDPNENPALSVATLRTVLGLTAAEARVAIALANGDAPEDIAAKHGITILTVRTHLRNAMAKTGITRLPELVALVLRCGSPIDPVTNETLTFPPLVRRARYVT